MINVSLPKVHPCTQPQLTHSLTQILVHPLWPTCRQLRVVVRQSFAGDVCDGPCRAHDPIRQSAGLAWHGADLGLASQKWSGKSTDGLDGGYVAPASTSASSWQSILQAYLAIKPISVHAFVDGGFVTDIFNDQVAITTVVEPSKHCADGLVHAWSSDAHATAQTGLEAWALTPAIVT